jgi:hypothetical protein
MIFGAGLGRVDLKEGRPIFFTVFMAPTISVHITKTERADEVVQKVLFHGFTLCILTQFTSKASKSMGESKE